MPLSDLPSEIILNIADQLDVAGTSGLSRTNQRLYSVLNASGYLYRRDLTQRSGISRVLLYGDLEITVPQALSAGQNLVTIPESYNHALGIAVAACAGGQPLRGKLLIELLLKVKGINPNTVNSNGDHGLVYAAHLGLTDIVKLFLDHPDIDPNFMSKQHTALMRAQTPEVAKLLLDRGDINVNLQDQFGWNALFCACISNNFLVARQLLEREDIDINARDGYGRTVLTDYCELGDDGFHVDVDMVRLLLSHHGIDPNPVDNFGESLLEMVISETSGPYNPCISAEIEPLLRAAGAR
jgi:ankyrin repeat protein